MQIETVRPVTAPEMIETLRQHGYPATTRWFRRETAANRIPTLKVGRRRVYLPDVVLKSLAERAGAVSVAR